MFFRESCYRRSGDKARAGVNPTLYRQPEEYEEFIKARLAAPAANRRACVHP